MRSAIISLTSVVPPPIPFQSPLWYSSRTASPETAPLLFLEKLRVTLSLTPSLSRNSKDTDADAEPRLM